MEILDLAREKLNTAVMYLLMTAEPLNIRLAELGNIITPIMIANDYYELPDDLRKRVRRLATRLTDDAVETADETQFQIIAEDLVKLYEDVAVAKAEIVSD